MTKREMPENLSRTLAIKALPKLPVPPVIKTREVESKGIKKFPEKNDAEQGKPDTVELFKEADLLAKKGNFSSAVEIYRKILSFEKTLPVSFSIKK